MGVRSLATNLVYHVRIKDIGIDMHFIREIIVSKLLEVYYVSMYAQVKVCPFSVSKSLKANFRGLTHPFV